jgi:type IV pilus assembly protein PilP
MTENPRAVLEDAAGKGFIVSKGALVGKNDGKVTEIFQDEVIVTEKSTDILGETKIKEIRIRLHEQEAKSK